MDYELKKALGWFEEVGKREEFLNGTFRRALNDQLRSHRLAVLRVDITSFNHSLEIEEVILCYRTCRNDHTYKVKMEWSDQERHPYERVFKAIDEDIKKKESLYSYC